MSEKKLTPNQERVWLLSMTAVILTLFAVFLLVVTREYPPHRLDAALPDASTPLTPATFPKGTP